MLIGGFAALHDPGAAQVGLEFVDRGFNLPALIVESGQLAVGPRRDQAWWLPTDKPARNPRFLPGDNRRSAGRSRWFCAASLAPRDTHGSNRSRRSSAPRRPCACSFSSARVGPHLWPPVLDTYRTPQISLEHFRICYRPPCPIHSAFSSGMGGMPMNFRSTDFPKMH